MSQQLSEILHNSMSPVKQALNIPQAPPQMFSPLPPPFPNMPNVPGAHSPHYNPNLSVFNPAIHQVQNLRGNAELRGIATEFYTPNNFLAAEGRGVRDPYTRRIQAAEELSIRRAAEANGFQGTFGMGNLSMPMNLLGSFAGAAAMGPLGLLLGGLGGSALGGVMNRSLFGEARDLRLASMQLRQSLNPTNIGFDLTDAGGQVDQRAAQDITNRVARLANEDSSFTSRDFMRITDHMARSGMLLQTGDTAGLVQRVKEVSRQLKTFAVIAGEDDIMEALKQMSQLRNAGIADVNLNQAASNARAFARMAGFSTKDTIAFGEQTSKMAQQMGFSGATGMQLGQMNLALAQQGSGAFSRAQMARFGGSRGLAQSMTRGMLQSQNHVTNDMLLHTLFRSRGGGEFDFNARAMQELLSGRGNLSNMFQDRMAQLRSSGNVMQHIQDFKERRPELQEALNQRLGPIGMQLMTLRRAQALQQASGGNMTLFTALQRITGNEVTARQIARISQSPGLAQSMLTRTIEENRRRQIGQRQLIEREGSFFNRMTTRLRRATDFGFSRGVARFNAGRQQEIRDRAMGIYGSDRDVDSMLSMSKEDRDRIAMNMARGTDGASSAFITGSLGADVGVPSFTVNPFDSVMGYGLRLKRQNEFLGYGSGILGRTARTLGQIVSAPFNGFSTMGRSGQRFDADMEDRIRQSADISRRAVSLFGNNFGNIGQALNTSNRIETAFQQGTNIDDDTMAMLNRTMMQEVRKGFRSRRAGMFSIFDDQKIDVKQIRENIMKRLRDQGLSDDQIQSVQARLDSDAGKNLMAGRIGTSMAFATPEDRARMRTQLPDHMQVSGLDGAGLRKGIISKVRKAGKDNNATSLMSDSSVMKFTKAVSEIAKNEDEGKFTAEVMQLMARSRQGGMKEEDVRDELDKIKEKYDLPTERVKEIISSISRTLDRDKDLSSMLTKAHSYGLSSAVDDSLANMGGAAARLRPQMQQAALQANMISGLEDMGVKGISRDKSLGLQLSKLADNDKERRRLLKSSSGREQQLGKLLTRLRSTSTDKDRAAVMKDIQDLLTGGDALKTGVREGSAPDKVARTQVAVARAMLQFAQKNERNTATFGKSVDSIASGAKDFRAGANRIKQAADTLAGKASGTPVIAPKKKPGG